MLNQAVSLSAHPDQPIAALQHRSSQWVIGIGQVRVFRITYGVISLRLFVLDCFSPDFSLLQTLFWQIVLPMRRISESTSCYQLTRSANFPRLHGMRLQGLKIDFRNQAPCRPYGGRRSASANSHRAGDGKFQSHTLASAAAPLLSIPHEPARCRRLGQSV